MTSSSASTAHHQRMLAEQRAHEPSMEEILASIRRIIADDRALPLTPRPAETAPPAPVLPDPAANEAGAPGRDLRAASHVAPPVEEPPLAIAGLAMESVRAELAAELAAEVTAAAPAPVAFEEPVEEPAAPAPVDPVAEPEAEPVSAEAEPEAALPVEAPLLSPKVGETVIAAFDQLAETVANSHVRVVEEAVRDMLRPMLKTWLDDNLPVIVERLVRVEIERVARGGR